jgi:hypothetical protein
MSYADSSGLPLPEIFAGRNAPAWLQLQNREVQSRVDDNDAIQGLIGFHGKSIAALRKKFEEADDDYSEACDK